MYMKYNIYCMPSSIKCLLTDSLIHALLFSLDVVGAVVLEERSACGSMFTTSNKNDCMVHFQSGHLREARN